MIPWNEGDELQSPRQPLRRTCYVRLAGLTLWLTVITSLEFCATCSVWTYVFVSEAVSSRKDGLSTTGRKR